MHGIDRAEISFVAALEFAVFLGYDGQLEQKSGIETDLFQSVMEQLNKTEMTKTENALMWLYVKTWGPKGQHVLDNENLWNFGGEDLDAAIMRICYPRKKETTNRIEDLRKLITERFEGIDELCKWSRGIHSEVRYS